MSLRRFVLIGINLVLLVAFWSLTNEMLSIRAPDPATYKPSSISLPVAVSRPEQPELARPLFRSGPSSSEHDPPLPATSSSPNVQLLGIVLTAERKTAIIELDGSTLRVEEGGDVNGWQVTSIEPRKIRLKNSEQYIDVLLDPQTDAR